LRKERNQNLKLKVMHSNKNINLKVTVVMLFILVIGIFADAAFGQSYTRTVYDNPITHTTTTKVVADKIWNGFMSAGRTRNVVYVNNHTAAYNAGYNDPINHIGLGENSVLRNKPIKADFNKIKVIQLDTHTDESIDNWENKNHCEYKINSARSKITFKEFSPNNNLVNSWSHEIIIFDEDDENVYMMRCKVKDGEITAILWKDLSMVVLIDTNFTYLIGEGL